MKTASSLSVIGLGATLVLNYIGDITSTNRVDKNQTNIEQTNATVKNLGCKIDSISDKATVYKQYADSITAQSALNQAQMSKKIIALEKSLSSLNAKVALQQAAKIATDTLKVIR